MGLGPAQIEKLEYTEEGTAGVHIVNGPTGSGKSTFMYNRLRRISRQEPGRRIVSIEKPVEYPMPWAIQLSLDDNAGHDDEGAGFESMFHHTLRMDPDIIVPGETRTAGVAMVVFQAGRTGHVVHTTTHADDGYSVPYRFELMDPVKLPLKMFCSARLLRSIINQRLVPKLCPNCSIPLNETDPNVISRPLRRRLETYGDLSDLKIRHDAGCKAPGCFQGYIGRQVIMEILLTDADMMKDFIDRGEDETRRRYRQRSDADKSVLAQAMDAALVGKYDIRDVGRYVDTITVKELVNVQ
jgi:type II secretory ATPase GspE/PulE/Tfp pilus assembly ATPase PilB-like protein